MPWILLALGVTTNAAASLLVKFAVSPPRQPLSLSDPIGALTNIYLWLGIILFGVTFLLFAASLEKIPLHIAQPILTSGAIVCVALGAAIIFREVFYTTTILGMILIISGVILMTWSS